MTTATTPELPPAADKTQPIVHTPGPWVVSPGHHFAVGTKTTACPIVNWMGFDDSFRQREEHLANAKLIAASPDMLELVRRAYKALHRGQWEEGETDAELSSRIADVMGSHFGDNWVV